MSDENSWVTPRFLEFYAYLDTTGLSIEEEDNPEGCADEDLVVPPRELESLAGKMAQNLRGQSGEKLTESVANLVRADPRMFLVLAHLYRQKKFTAAELAYFFFDGGRTQETAYFSQIEATDPEFRKAVGRARKTAWISDTNPVQRQILDLAAFKKAVSSYLRSEVQAWNLWRSRIANDTAVSVRVAKYVVEHEKLEAAIASEALVELLRHTMRASSSEDTKLDVGELGASRLEEQIKGAGFVEPSCPHGKHSELDDLDSCAKRACSSLWYEREVHSARFDRRFDFALASPSGVRYIIETNYYSSAGSKIDKTVKDFRELEPKLRDRHPLIYVTDGIGWLGLVSLLRVLVEVDASRQMVGIPFFFNLRQFHDYLPALASGMSRGSPGA